MPPPTMLAEYERVVPGLAKKIAERADLEQSFRHEITRENQAIARRAGRYAVAIAFSGQILSAGLATLAIGGGLWLISNGHSVAGLAAIISAMAALVAAFITGKIMSDKAAKKQPHGE